VKNFIRNREFFKIATALETGADHDMWSFQRYMKWLDNRTQWFIPDQNPEPPDSETGDAPPPVMYTPPKPGRPVPTGVKVGTPPPAGGRLEIEAVEGGLEDILKRFK